MTILRAMALLLFACFATAEASADGGCAPDAATAAAVDYVEGVLDGETTEPPDFQLYVPLCVTGIHEDLLGVRLFCETVDADGRAGEFRWENIALSPGSGRPASIERVIRIDWTLDDGDTADIAAFQCELVLQAQDAEPAEQSGVDPSDDAAPFNPMIGRAIEDWDSRDYCVLEEDWRRQVCRRPDRSARRAISARIPVRKEPECRATGSEDCVAPPEEADCTSPGEMDCAPPLEEGVCDGTGEIDCVPPGDENEADLFLPPPEEGDRPEVNQTISVTFAEFLEFHGGRAQNISLLQAFMEEVDERDSGLYDNWYQPSAMRDSLTGHDRTPAAYRASSNDLLHDWLDDPVDDAWWDYNESGLRTFSYNHHRALDRAVDALAFEPDDDIFFNSLAYFQDGMEAWRRGNQEIDQAYFECFLSRQEEAMRLHDVYQGLPWNENEDAYNEYRAQLGSAHACVSESALEAWTQRPHFTWPMQTVEREPPPESGSEQ